MFMMQIFSAIFCQNLCHLKITSAGKALSPSGPKAVAFLPGYAVVKTVTIYTVSRILKLAAFHTMYQTRFRDAFLLKSW